MRALFVEARLIQSPDVFRQHQIFSCPWVLAKGLCQTRHDGVPAHTSEQIEFLDLVDTIAHEPGFALNMDFRPGDIQMVCNYTTFHSRTAYEDHEDPAKKRHLLRLWLTLHNGRAMPDDFGRGNASDGKRGGIQAVPGIAEALAGTYI